MSSTQKLIVLLLSLAVAGSVYSETPPGPPIRFRPDQVGNRFTSQALDRQHRALSAMPAIQVSYAPQGTVRLISGRTGITVSNRERQLRVGESGSETLAKLKDLLMTSGDEALTVSRNVPSGTKYQTLVFNQSIRGLPVLGGVVALGFNPQTGSVDTITAEFLPDYRLPRQSSISAATVEEIATKFFYSALSAQPESVQIAGKPKLAYYGAQEDAGKAALVWVVSADYIDENSNAAAQEVWIDAITGQVLFNYSLVANAINRTAYSANGTAPQALNLPAGTTLLFTEGNEAGGDTHAVNAYGATGLADSAWRTYSNKGVSSAGIVVHYAIAPAYNAGSVRTSSGAEFHFYGDGIPGSYISPAMSSDAVGHEYGHSIFRSTGIIGFAGTTDSATIEEAYSDFSSVLTDMYIRGGGVSAETWEIYPAAIGDTRGVRSWAFPRNSLYPGYDWYPTAPLTRGVHHERSTVGGHAFKLMVTGGQHNSAGIGDVPVINVPAISPSAARLVWLFALDRPEMATTPSFIRFRQATYNASLALLTPEIAATVAQAWDAVGVGYNCSSPPATPNMQLEDYLCRGRYRVYWDAVPGATRFYAEKVRSGYPWSLASPVVDANTTQCETQVSQTTSIRMKACNGCGCSEFTLPQTMQWWPQCL